MPGPLTRRQRPETSPTARVEWKILVPLSWDDVQLMRWNSSYPKTQGKTTSQTILYKRWRIPMPSEPCTNRESSIPDYWSALDIHAHVVSSKPVKQSYWPAWRRKRRPWRSWWWCSWWRSWRGSGWSWSQGWSWGTSPHGDAPLWWRFFFILDRW